MSSGTENLPEKPAHYRVGIFITRVVVQLPDGRLQVSHSRGHRKGLPPVEIGLGGIGVRAALVTNPWLHLWAPTRLAWWIAVLFIIGSSCFALGSFASNWPQYLSPEFGGSGVINTVFFVGSLFFTSAAGLQLLEAINGDVADIDTPGRHWHWFAWKPHNAGYSASLIQFAGTVLFNFNTADAMITGLGWVGEDLLIWTPDVIGSVCFLVASYLALIEVSHDFWSFQPRQVDWWIADAQHAGFGRLYAGGRIHHFPATHGWYAVGLGRQFLHSVGRRWFFQCELFNDPGALRCDREHRHKHGFIR